MSHSVKMSVPDSREFLWGSGGLLWNSAGNLAKYPQKKAILGTNPTPSAALIIRWLRCFLAPLRTQLRTRRLRPIRSISSLKFPGMKAKVWKNIMAAISADCQFIPKGAAAHPVLRADQSRKLRFFGDCAFCDVPPCRWCRIGRDFGVFRGVAAPRALRKNVMAGVLVRSIFRDPGGVDAPAHEAWQPTRQHELVGLSGKPSRLA